MKHINKMYWMSFFTLVIFGIAGFAVWSSVQSKNIERLIVENKTQFLSIESVKELDVNGELSVFEITVKNNYDKPISVFRFRMTDASTKRGDINAVERGGLTDGWKVDSSETTVVKFSAAKKGEVHLTIAAVLFEDGTGDGVNDDLVILQNIRKGVLLGFQKIVPVLKEETKTSGFLSSDTKFVELEKKIKQINDSEIPDISKRGFATAQDFIKFEIEDLKEKFNSKPGLDVNTEFLTKLGKMESRISDLLENSTPDKKKKGGKYEN